MKRLLVLASGRGSNFQALLAAVKDGVLRAEIAALGVSKPGAGAIEIAAATEIPVIVAPTEREILDYVEREHIDAIVLAGYLKILSPEFIAAMRDERGISRILNIHPSLLPAYPGLNSYRQAFAAGAKETGVTVHLVEPEVDAGPILAQRSFSIEGLKTPEAVESRGLAIEHELYARTIEWFVNGEYRAESREGKLHVARI